MKRESDSRICGEGSQEIQLSNSVGPNKIMKTESKESFKFSSSPDMENIRKSMEEFVNERNWEQFHTPRNILLALVGEVGELAELFQWRGEVKKGLPDWSEKDKEHLGQELSDVLLYLVRLADRCEVDLPTAVVKKMEQNRQKYPAGKVYGSSKKYNEYKETFEDGESSGGTSDSASNSQNK